VWRDRVGGASGAATRRGAGAPGGRLLTRVGLSAVAVGGPETPSIATRGRAAALGSLRVWTEGDRQAV
jgi:hypothetical protein